MLVKPLFQLYNLPLVIPFIAMMKHTLGLIGFSKKKKKYKI